MIHVGELTVAERRAIELLHSAMRRLADRYSDGCDWREFHYMTAYNLLREKVIAFRVDACNRRTE